MTPGSPRHRRLAGRAAAQSATPLFVRRAEAHALSGLLLLFAPVALPIYRHWMDGGAYFAALIRYGGAVVGGLGLALGGAMLLRPTLQGAGRALGTVGALSLLGLVLLGLADSPSRGFLAILATLILLTRIWPDHQPGEPSHTCEDAFARGAAKAGLGAWALGAGAAWATDLVGALGLGASLVGACAACAAWTLKARRARRPAWRTVGAATGIGLLIGVLTVWELPALGATALLLGPLSLLVVSGRDVGQGLLGLLWEELSVHPARSMVATFAVLIGGGTLLLSLPVSAAGDTPVSLVDALFTAVSASCVTGLAVLDTPTAWSLFGQIVIFVLFQVGGLGIMAFSAGGLLLLGRRIGIRQELAMGDLLGSVDGVGPALRRLFLYTFGVEAFGAVVLTLLFWAEGDSMGYAAWRGLFTSVSAFCNAGFALQSDSMVSYNERPALLHAVALLVIFGSFGPVPSRDLLRMLARKSPLPSHRWPLLRRFREAGVISLQSRLAIYTSALLLVIPAALFLAMEWSTTLAGLSIADKVHNAWFQSVILRTAGFNSVDLARCLPPTVLLMMVLMFIGGSPGSTAGGVKTTTAALLALALSAAVRGDQRVAAFGREVPSVVIFRAIATMTAATGTVAVALIVLLLVQDLDPLVALYEVVSAVGTVGTTIGASAQLDEIGKIIVSGCMFAGRVGPLTLFLLLPGRSGQKPIGLPEEEVAVG